MAIQEIVFFSRRDIGRHVTVEKVVGDYPIPSRLVAWGNVVSSPSGIWNGAVAANDFGTLYTEFCAI